MQTYTYQELVTNFINLSNNIVKYVKANVPPTDNGEWHYVTFLELPGCLNKYDSNKIVRVYIAGDQGQTHAIEFGGMVKVALYKETIEFGMSKTFEELCEHYEMCLSTTMDKLLPEWLKTQEDLPESQKQLEVL